MIKTLNNLVAIKPFPSDEIRLKDGNKLYLANVFEEYLNARTAGIVVGLPDRLKFSDDMYAVSMPWKTELELQEGDRVVFNYLADKNSKGLGYFFEDGVMCVPYEQIYVAFRGDDMICLNGFIIVEPDEDEIKTILEVPEIAKSKSKIKGTVRYAGKPNQGYRDELMEKGRTSPDYQINVGDRVMFHWTDAIPLQPNAELRGELTRKLMYRMQHKDVLGIEVNLSI